MSRTDIDDPFVPVEITHQAKDYYDWINDNIWELNRLQKEKREIEKAPGSQCTEPYECWYYDYCHGMMNVPEQINMNEFIYNADK